MLKFGIHSLEQLENAPLKTRFGGTKKISISLLKDIKDHSNADELRGRILMECTGDRGAF